MASSIAWLIPCRVILWEYSGDVSLEDVAGGYQMVFRMFEEVQEGPVHFLVDFSEAGRVLFKIEEIASLSIDPIWPLVGWFVYVGQETNFYYRAITDMLATVRDTRMEWLPTREEGLAFLKAQDSTLSDWD